MNKKPTLLLIMDGFGFSEATAEQGNGVAAARKPNIERLWRDYPHGFLRASGEAVGLPPGQMGNSEVGHLNIGAGRVVYQELSRITREIRSGVFFENPVLCAACDRAAESGGDLHLMGLVSDGGVHSTIGHCIALLELAQRRGVRQVFVHCFLDGRDVLPTSALTYLDQLQAATEQFGGRLATVMGGYYAMDRDKRYDRLELAWKALVDGEGKLCNDYHQGVKESYDGGVTDEFVKPLLLTDDGQTPRAVVKDGDSIIFFNFRTDRARELLWTFKDPHFDGFPQRHVPEVDYTVFTQCDANIDVPVAYPKEVFVHNFGQYLAEQGRTQLRIAETEKYAHVTFFFNGQVEEPNPGEDRILIPSPKDPSYDTVPRMSADQVTAAVLEAIGADQYDAIILNFANPDMVGHTGNFDAVVQAVECVDECVGKVVEAVLARGGAVFLTADHGNAEKMKDGKGGAFTAHTANPVLYVVIGAENVTARPEGVLADIAPTLLQLMGLPQPPEMTGRPLI